MAHDSGLCTNDHEWIKTKIKTPICLNSKGNEVITWCSFDVGLCLFSSNHRRCMCCCSRCLLHHIYASWVSKDNVCQSMQVVFGNKNIHLSSSVTREKVGASFWTRVLLSKAIVTIIFWSVWWVDVRSFPQGHWNKWVLRSSMVWPHWHCERCVIVGCGKPR